MEPAFKEMGQLVVSVGRLVARQCDHYVRAILGADYSPSTQLFDLLTTSQCCKGRLLHYFAQDEVARHTQATGEQKGQEKETPTDDTDFSDWCGWHNDHGSLTGLVPAIYMKEGKLVQIFTASHYHSISTTLIFAVKMNISLTVHPLGGLPGPSSRSLYPRPSGPAGAHQGKASISNKHGNL
jgi:hypothetical protein